VVINDVLRITPQYHKKTGQEGEYLQFFDKKKFLLGCSLFHCHTSNFLRFLVNKFGKIITLYY